MPDKAATPARISRHVHVFSLTEVLRILGAALVAGIALGLLINHYDGETIKNVARIVCTVAMTAVLLIISDARRRSNIDGVRERLARIEEILAGQLDNELAGYNRGYLDCLREGKHH